MCIKPYCEPLNPEPLHTCMCICCCSQLQQHCQQFQLLPLLLPLHVPLLLHVPSPLIPHLHPEHVHACVPACLSVCYCYLCSGTASNIEEALAIAAEIGRFPLIIRPAFTLGGTGGGISYNLEEFKEQVKAGIDASMTDQVWVLQGWCVSMPWREMIPTY